MVDLGDVFARMPGEGQWLKCKLLGFETIPVKWEDNEGNFLEHKVIVYAILEVIETGDFIARQLQEINRKGAVARIR